MKSMRLIRSTTNIPEAFSYRDHWIVINTNTNTPIQSGNEVDCTHAAEVCNAHELRNGRPQVYSHEQVEA